MGDARVHIEDLLNGDSGESVAAPYSPRPSPLMPWLLAGALAIGLAATWVWTLKPPSLPVTRLGLVLPAGRHLDGNGGGHILALSPSGVQIAFVGSPAAIYLRSMSSEDVKAIPGTEGFGAVREPVFSPDGGSIAFYADQTLKRIAVDGSGVAVTICPAKNPYGISWGADGIVFGQGAEGIMRVSLDGGTPQRIASVKHGEIAHGPQILPGGQQVLFTVATGTAADRWDKARIVVQSLTTGEQVTVINGGSDARYVPSGHLLYAVGGRLLVVAFDERRLRVVGDAVPIVEGLSRSAANWSGAANVSVANNGSLVYVPGPVTTPGTLMNIALVDRRTGKVEVLNLPPRQYAWPRVSPDGKRLAFATEDGKEPAIWTYDLSGTVPAQQLTTGGNNRFPVWTSATSVAFQSDRDGDLAIFQQSIGSSPERLTKPDKGTTHAPESWSETTDTLLFSVAEELELSLWALSLRERTRTLFTTVTPSSTKYATGAVFSPDGRWVAYASAPRGATTIYVEPFPATGARYPLVPRGSDGPHEPVWSPDGKTLFYNPQLGRFEAVNLTTQPTFAFGNPVPLARKLQMGPPGSRTNYDITPNGAFVGLITAGETNYDTGSNDRIQVVLNWFEDAKARLAGR